MDWEAIWKRARNDFLHTKSSGDVGLLLWEHSIRVARSASKILCLDEVVAAQPDEAAVITAALFHHSGWIVRTRNEERLSDAQLLSPLTDADRDLAAALLMQSLETYVPQKSLSRAAQAIKDAGNRKSDSIDAIVVADADALDEFGIPALWASIRRGTIEGRATQAAIETWRRQIEYRFWEARLHDAFRIDAVRAVARARLDRFALLMKNLAEEHNGADMDFEGSLVDEAAIGGSFCAMTDAAMATIK